MKKSAVCIVKEHHLKRSTYLQIMSIGLSDLIWKVFITIMNLTNEKSKKLKFFIDSILININCDLRFDCIDKVVYRGKTRYFVNDYVCKSKIMLPAKINLQLFLLL